MATMDIDEAKVYAGQIIVRDLCSGKDFRGLGPAAEMLVRDIARSADENAKLVNSETTRTSEAFFEMMERVKNQFVLDVLGFGGPISNLGVQVDGPMTPQQAAYKLVDSVWEAYINWAKEAMK